MTFAAFRLHVFAAKWSLAALRCEVPPTAGLLDFMDRVGAGTYERFVVRLQQEADANLSRMAFGAEYK